MISKVRAILRNVEAWTVEHWISWVLDRLLRKTWHKSDPGLSQHFAAANEVAVAPGQGPIKPMPN
jgi:hypothetical protein